MGCVNTQVVSSLFLLPETLAIDGVYPTTTHLTIQVRCVLKSEPVPSVSIPQNGFTADMGELG